MASLRHHLLRSAAALLLALLLQACQPNQASEQPFGLTPTPEQPFGLTPAPGEAPTPAPTRPS